MNISERKKSALDLALAQVERQFGKEATTNTKKVAPLVHVDTVSTGSVGLDIALGVGGLALGHCVEIYGPPSSGKTSLALSTIAQAQKKGMTCAVIDTEQSLNPDYAEILGVDTDNLIFSQPDTGEQALEICSLLAKSKAVDVIVIDSVAALAPKAELEGAMGDDFYGLQARLLSHALKSLVGIARNSNCMIIFVNQIRIRLDVVWGNNETTPGGSALKFYSSVRLDIRRMGSLKKNGEVTGNEIRVKVVKNKLSDPFKQAVFQMDYKKGINHISEMVDIGIKESFITKENNRLYYNTKPIGSTCLEASQWFFDNPVDADELSKQIRDTFFFESTQDDQSPTLQ